VSISKLSFSRASNSSMDALAHMWVSFPFQAFSLAMRLAPPVLTFGPARGGSFRNDKGRKTPDPSHAALSGP